MPINNKNILSNLKMTIMRSLIPQNLLTSGVSSSVKFKAITLMINNNKNNKCIQTLPNKLQSIKTNKL